MALLPLLEKRAKEERGSVTIFPAFPFVPLMAWGLSALLDRGHPELRFYVVGGLPVALALVSVIYAANYANQIRRRTKH